MAEPIKINLLDPDLDKKVWQTAENFQGEQDTVYVFVHGSPKHVVDYRKGRAHPEFLGPLELAQMLDKKGATRESRVVLVACSTAQGMHSFAREFSQYYDVVVAATRQLRTDARNESEFYAKAIIAGTDQQGQPDLHDPGKMKFFYGADYQFCNTHPQECDPPQSERPPPAHEFKVFGATLTIKEDNIISPVTLFKPGLASNPISPQEAIEQRKVEAQLFFNIVDLKGAQAQLARQQAVHHYPELAHAFAAFDHRLQQSRGRTDAKEYLGDQIAEIMLAIEQGETYALDIGANAKAHVAPVVATEAQAYSR